MEGIKQEFFKLWQDIKNSFSEGWKNWLCEAGFHQGKTKTAPHDNLPNTDVEYCDRCKGIIREVPEEKEYTWTSEAS